MEEAALSQLGSVGVSVFGRSGYGILRRRIAWGVGVLDWSQCLRQRCETNLDIILFSLTKTYFGCNHQSASGDSLRHIRDPDSRDSTSLDGD